MGLEKVDAGTVAREPQIEESTSPTFPSAIGKVQITPLIFRTCQSLGDGLGRGHGCPHQGPH